MKLYLLTQTDNNTWDSFDSCIVCAKDVDDAKSITSTGNVFKENSISTWAQAVDSIICKEVGTANDNQERGVVIASFNGAG